MITSSYGSWARRVEHSDGMTVEDTVSNALADAHFVNTSLTDAIVKEYRAAINAALPDSVELCGSEFYGPAYAADEDFDGFDRDEDGRLDINAIVCAIDFYAIAEAVEDAAVTV
jgi:hypothetical protein